MRLTVHLPTKRILDAEVSEVRAEDPTGSFGVREGHEPFMTALAMGLVYARETGGAERWLAVDEGILLTDGESVEIYTHDAQAADSPEAIHRLLEKDFADRHEAERDRRNAMVKMQLAAFRMLFGFER
jgi:F-type H+-transporting ATPase subunit epsilon